MKELNNFREFLNEEEQVKEGYTPNEDEIKDAKTFIEHLNIYIKTAENYINGQYDQDEMSINGLVDDLNATSKYMAIKFPSYKN